VSLNERVEGVVTTLADWQPLFSFIEASEDLTVPEIALEAGECLFRQGDSAKSVYLLLEGELDVYRELESGEKQRVAKIAEGSSVGEIALMGIRERSATVEAKVHCRLLEVSIKVFELAIQSVPEIAQLFSQIVEHRLPALKLRSLDILEGISDSSLAQIQHRLEWKTMLPGEVLFREGDDSDDGLYILLQGRLGVFVTKGESAQQIAQIEVGTPVGEMGLICKEPRTATVRALRKSTLVQIPTDVFETAIQSHPKLLMQLLRIVTQRLKAASHRGRQEAHGSAVASTVALIPISRDLPSLNEIASNIAEGFGEVLVEWIDIDRINTELGKGASEVEQNNPRNLLISDWLEKLEHSTSYTIYLGALDHQVWNDRCVQRADRIVLVARADNTINLEQVKAILPEYIPIELLLLREHDITMPQGTIKLLSEFSFQRHHHAQIGRPDDLRRVGRFISHRAVGIVFGGGGARGAAHIGVMKALNEANIPVDYVGGASVGGLVAACVAMGMKYDAMIDVFDEMFLRSRAGKVYVLPLISVYSARGTERACTKIFSDIMIEDLPLNFFCTGSNLSTLKLHVLERGPLASALRVTGSYPGLIPPVPRDGELLVDGGLLNNLPVDVMQSLCPGTLISVNISLDSDLFVGEELLYSPSPWKLLLQKWFGRNGRSVMFPTLGTIITRTVDAAGNIRQRELSALADISLAPPITDFGLTDFNKANAIAQAGYNYTRTYLAELTSADPEQAARLSVL
jgi:predicted acylesterase/phospholipase RssA/CRP-like cAMP-binding protein|tara:strand:+ start:459 stop:2693 length:2235 start_codon:yes stop_codon:yes gene_type:complete